MRRRALLLAAAAACMPTARAKPFDTTPPAEVNAALPDVKLRGHGRLRWFGVHVYDAVLWAAALPPDGEAQNAPLALELRYARALRGRQIADRSLDEMKRVGDMSEADGQRWLEAMTRLFPDVHAGDRITGVHRPGAGADFFVNGRSLGEVRDARFASLFFGIWLSPRTSQPALRAALLGTPP